LSQKEPWVEDEDGSVEEPPQKEEEPARGQLRDRGASLVEYALLLALICIVCLAAVSALGGNNEKGLNHSQSCIAAAMDGAHPAC
jgi:Flp pilus assembly pilin Flp